MLPRIARIKRPTESRLYLLWVWSPFFIQGDYTRINPSLHFLYYPDNNLYKQYRVCICHSIHVEVIGQLAKADSLFPLCRFQGLNLAG